MIEICRNHSHILYFENDHCNSTLKKKGQHQHSDRTLSLHEQSRSVHTDLQGISNKKISVKFSEIISSNFQNSNKIGEAAENF
jgi:hypothetical protein